MTGSVSLCTGSRPTVLAPVNVDVVGAFLGDPVDPGHGQGGVSVEEGPLARDALKYHHTKTPEIHLERRHVRTTTTYTCTDRQ